MAKRLTPLALLLVGCATDEEMAGTGDSAPLERATAEALAALRDWDRAPYSPPGWPLEVGDRIRPGPHQELTLNEFPSWQGHDAVFWMGDQSYGAYFTGEHEILPGSDTPLDRSFGHFMYQGHFPVKTPKHPDEWLDWEWQIVAAPPAPRAYPRFHP